MCDRADKHKIPPGKAIIMDYSAEEGPVMITHDYVGPVQHHSKHPDDYFQNPKPGIQRRFGEADHALPFWCRVFAPRPRIFVMSVDSDVLANMAVYVSTSNIDLLDNSQALEQFRGTFEGATGNPGHNIAGVVGQYLGHHKELIWVRPDFRHREKRAKIPYEQIDLLDLYHRLLYKEMKERFSPERKQSLGEGGAVNCTLIQFLLICTLNGTDYVDKKEVAHRIGADKIIAALLKDKIPYRVHMPTLRGPVARRRIAPNMIQELHQSYSLFPVDDHDPRYCDEVPVKPVLADVVPPVYRATDLTKPWGEQSWPAQSLESTAGGWMLNGDVGFQLAYWLVNYNLFTPSRTFGDPVARYVRITSAKQQQQGVKRKRQDEDEEEQRPLKRAVTLAHTACEGDQAKMPHEECARCMAEN